MSNRLGLLAILVAALFGASCRPQAEDDGEDATSAFERKDIDKEWVSAASGPWGTLEYRRFFLPLPQTWLHQSPPPAPAVWAIPDTTVEKLQAVIAATPLSEEERRLWQTTCQVEPNGSGVLVRPSNEFRWSLQPKSRAMLYVWLAQFPENQAQNFPFCYPAASFDDWMQDHHLSAQLSESIRRLVYPVGSSICFADLDLINEQVTDKEMHAELLSILYRRPYCEVRIRIDQKTDIKALSTYWGEWHRVDRVKRKLTETLGTQPQAYASLASILPPLPRSLLNTYPAAPKNPQDIPPDCYWTAFNFFNRSPDNRFTDTAFMEEALAKYHDRVEGKPRYGDLIFLVGSSGHPVHGAVYLADDFVFTKNGGHFTQPWVIMKLADMKSCYPQPTPLREAYYRWNPQKTRPKSS